MFMLERPFVPRMSHPVPCISRAAALSQQEQLLVPGHSTACRIAELLSNSHDTWWTAAQQEQSCLLQCACMLSSVCNS